MEIQVRNLPTNRHLSISDAQAEAEIQAALATWTPTGLILLTEDLGDPDIIIEWIDSLDLNTIGRGETPPPCETEANRHRPIRVQLNARLRWRIGDNGPLAFDIRSAVIHEIGHALGFEHSNDPLSVMFEDPQFNQTLSPADQALLQRKYPLSSGDAPGTGAQPQPQP